jgi:hypothetical protein
VQSAAGSGVAADKNACCHGLANPADAAARLWWAQRLALHLPLLFLEPAEGWRRWQRIRPCGGRSRGRVGSRASVGSSSSSGRDSKAWRGSRGGAPQHLRPSDLSRVLLSLSILEYCPQGGTLDVLLRAAAHPLYLGSLNLSELAEVTPACAGLTQGSPLQGRGESPTAACTRTWTTGTPACAGSASACCCWAGEALRGQRSSWLQPSTSHLHA